jgi:predicted unusual protein kinase regulating ubiquinone biosynthesis (AarF/ABC1/UbiB family)
VGIVTEYSESDHQAIVDILSAFIQREGRRAGELMIDESHRRNMAVVAEEKFLDKMEALTKRATSKENYLMQQLGVYSKYNVHMCTCSHAHMLTCSLQSRTFAMQLPTITFGLSLPLCLWHWRLKCKRALPWRSIRQFQS